MVLRFGIHQLAQISKLLWVLLLCLSSNMYWAKRIINLSIIYFFNPLSKKVRLRILDPQGRHLRATQSVGAVRLAGEIQQAA